jgi:hypothetical protein
VPVGSHPEEDEIEPRALTELDDEDGLVVGGGCGAIPSGSRSVSAFMR